MTLESDVAVIIEALNEQAAPILSKRLSVSYMVGWKLGGSKAQLTDVQKKAIAGLSKEQMGYISEFHGAIGQTLLDNVKADLAEGGGYKSARGEITPIVESVFGKDGKVVINRVGETKWQVALDKNGVLRREQITISRPYTTTVQNYSEMLSKTSVHSALSQGRIESYKARNIKKVRYISVLDSRTRPEHMALSGKVFETDSEDMENVQSLLSSPHCRCRLIPYFDDPDLDTPDEVFKSDRDRVSFNSDKGAWEFSVPITSNILYSFNEHHDAKGRFASGGGSSGGMGAKPASETEKQKVIADFDDRLSKNTNKASLVSFYQEKADRGETTKAEFKTPQGYTPERKALHDGIESEILSSGTSSDNPEIVFFGGPSASGKGGLTNYVDGKGKNHVNINNDEIKKKLPEYRGESAAILHDEARDITDSVLVKAMDGKKNIIFDSTLRNPEKSKALFEVARQKGYKVKMVSTNIPLDQSAKRASDRFLLPGKEGRYVPIKHMVKEHDITNAAQFELLNFADEGMILDSNVPQGKPYKVLKTKGK